MKRIRITAIVGGVVLAASLLGACSKGSSSSSTTTAAKKTTTTAAQSASTTAMAGTNFQQFSDPSGTISCAGGLISGSSNNVTCETASKGFEAFVALTSDGTIVKTSGFQPTGPANTLPAGSMSLLGAADGKGITCKAAATAITCTANNGKGFTMSTTSLTYVGGAVAAS
jgi:hypothetical protein